MPSLFSLVSYLDTFLETHAAKDASWNGLQFQGCTTVKKCLFAVDAGMQTFERAAAAHADMIVVHHGLFWTPVNPSMTGVMKNRIDILYKNNISLYACHLPLDMHKTVGNNAGILALLGARINGPFAVYNGSPISYTGLLKTATTLDSVTEKLNGSLRTKCTVLPFGPKKIKKVGVLSGSCSHAHVLEAISAGLDLFITGEQIDVFHLARDAGINIVFAGHHATETTGVKLLAGHVAKKMNVKTVFADIPTGL